MAVASAALLLAAALGSYFLLLRPQRARLEALKEERATLTRQLDAARTGVQRNEDTQTSVRRILDSLREFEEKHLGQDERGSTGVIEELNRLIRRNSLRISGGLAFTPLEELTSAQQQQQQRNAQSGGRKVVQSIYPGIGVTMTVEGTYPALRRFIRDVEADKQFVVIDAVELEGVTDTDAPRATGAGVEPGVEVAAPTVRGTLVSLRLDMAAYFRRSGAAQTTGPDGGARQ